MSVCGNGRHTAVDAVLGIPVLDLFAVQNDLALAALKVVDRLHQLLLAVSVDTCDTDDLARADLQIEVLDCVDALLVFDIQILNIQNNSAGIGRRLVDDQLDSVADHHGCQIILRYALDRNGIDVMSAADDGAHIRGSLDLFELVRDDDDRLSVLDQVPHDREELVDLLLCQDCRGLVQDQDLSTSVESLEDLDALLHADCDVADLRVRVYVETVFLNDLEHVLPGLLHIERDAALCGLRAKNDVLRDCEILNQHEVLVDHTDSVFNCRSRILDINFLAADVDLSHVCLVKTVQDVHQRTLTGAVLTENGMDRSLLHIEIDVGQRIEGAESFGDPMHLHSIFAADFCRHS